jgi:ABC-2 type transport system permease protein
VRGLLDLTWLEIKIFVREPLGVVGTVGFPVVAFVVLGRLAGQRATQAVGASRGLAVDVPVLAAILMTLAAVLSLVTVIAIYREGGILKRLRATPLRPQTILTAHVLVKLLFTLLTLALMALAGRRYYPMDLTGVPWAGFSAALVFTTVSILSMGFLIASLVPTARFAQPLGSIILYPMIAVSGLFVPVDQMPSAVQAVAHALPLTYAVSLLRGAWLGEPWSAHVWDVAALVVVFGACTALSARFFRWE